MRKTEIKIHFEEREFLKSKTIPKDHDLTFKESTILEWWMIRLSIVREMLGFGISVTDGLRIHNGSKSRSQHYYDEKWCENGAVDIRPSKREDSNQFLNLALVLAAHPEIKRVCYYVPSDRFAVGGFHCDCRGDEKVLFINEGSEIDWQQVDQASFISRVKGHAVDIKA